MESHQRTLFGLLEFDSNQCRTETDLTRRGVPDLRRAIIRLILGHSDKVVTKDTVTLAITWCEAAEWVREFANRRGLVCDRSNLLRAARAWESAGVLSIGHIGRRPVIVFFFDKYNDWLDATPDSVDLSWLLYRDRETKVVTAQDSSGPLVTARDSSGPLVTARDPKNSMKEEESIHLLDSKAPSWPAVLPGWVWSSPAEQLRSELVEWQQQAQVEQFAWLVGLILYVRRRAKKGSQPHYYARARKTPGEQLVADGEAFLAIVPQQAATEGHREHSESLAVEQFARLEVEYGADADACDLADIQARVGRDCRAAIMALRGGSITAEAFRRLTRRALLRSLQNSAVAVVSQ